MRYNISGGDYYVHTKAVIYLDQFCLCLEYCMIPKYVFLWRVINLSSEIVIEENYHNEPLILTIMNIVNKH